MKCLHERRRQIVRRAYKGPSKRDVEEMYERYKHDRARGVVGDENWRQIVRWEIDRAKRLGS